MKARIGPRPGTVSLLICGVEHVLEWKEASKLGSALTQTAKKAAGEEELALIQAQREAARRQREERASKFCRPVWKEEPKRPGPWVLVAWNRGGFELRDGGWSGFFYSPRDGRPVSPSPAFFDFGRLDVEATAEAWRAWCAQRREG